MSEVKELKAGRELDALIAEKVMGWHREFVTDPSSNYSFWNYVDADGRGMYTPEEWEPSTSISAAWEVVEKLQTLGIKCWMKNYIAIPGWHCVVIGGDFEFEEAADTAPLAICLAALKAVGA